MGIKALRWAAFAPLAGLVMGLSAGCSSSADGPSVPVVSDSKLQTPGDKEKTGFDPGNPLGKGVKAKKGMGGNK